MLVMMDWVDASNCGGRDDDDDDDDEDGDDGVGDGWNAEDDDSANNRSHGLQTYTYTQRREECSA